MKPIVLSRGDFELIRNLINKKTGIFFDERKKYFLASRLSTRMENLGLSSVRDYWY
ncbi:MAG TPA: protein-glutamate O-methyltransferase CheR, partial [Candidatus Aerophobetes bacterium]|nr:protein-glutamate O-methyltransferase CheR [Candidatus Aerophobetes bacterium]